MGFTLHFGGAGVAFRVAETVSLGDDDDDPVAYSVADLMADVRACVARGGDWHLLPLEPGGSVDIWFGTGVPMYIVDDVDGDTGSTSDLHHQPSPPREVTGVRSAGAAPRHLRSSAADG